jgi:pimeloyl-ACP methyl ester carboxylesterase
MLASFPLLAQAQGKERFMKHPTFYRTIQIDGLSVFYREAGPKDAPVLLLLHGLPSSSRMFEPLFARLSDNYHLVAPDYPGFGHSDWPDPKKFAYTFDHLAEIMSHFAEELGLSRHTLYTQDYGGPVGFRMILARPEPLEALIIQDAVAHDRGLGANWKTRRAFWADRAANEGALRVNLLSLATTRTPRRERSQRGTLRPGSLPPMRSPHWSEALPVPQVAGPDIHEQRNGTSVAQLSTGD